MSTEVFPLGTESPEKKAGLSHQGLPAYFYYFNFLILT